MSPRPLRLRLSQWGVPMKSMRPAVGCGVAGPTSTEPDAGAIRRRRLVQRAVVIAMGLTFLPGATAHAQPAHLVKDVEPPLITGGLLTDVGSYNSPFTPLVPVGSRAFF